MHYLIFDLDGTLTDPKIGITRSIQYALAKLGAIVPDMDDLRWCIGPPLRETFPILLHTDDPTCIERAVAYYRERFGTVGKFENTVYDQIPETLNTLQEMGAQLYVATAKPLVYAQDILDYFTLSRYFDGVYGSELDGRLTDKGELIAHLLARETLSPAMGMMVGDRALDILGAKQNRLKSIGVTYGYGTREELFAARADIIAHTPREIIVSVEKSRVYETIQ